MAKNRLNHPTVDKNAEFVLRSIPTGDVIPNNEEQREHIEYVESIEAGIVRTTDFEKARVFKGSWLNETVWSWNLNFKPITYIEAQNEWRKITARKADARKSKSTRRNVERLQGDRRSHERRSRSSRSRSVPKKQVAKRRKRTR